MSDIRVGSSIRTQARSGVSSDVPEDKRDSGQFTRKVADSAGRRQLLRGSIEEPGPAFGPQPTPVVIGFCNMLLNTRYRESTAGTNSRRNEITLALETGETAVIKGDQQNRTFKIRTQRGVVQEGTFGADGAQALRGFQTPQEFRDQLTRMLRATGWENARALPDR